MSRDLEATGAEGYNGARFIPTDQGRDNPAVRTIEVTPPPTDLETLLNQLEAEVFGGKNLTEWRGRIENGLLIASGGKALDLAGIMEDPHRGLALKKGARAVSEGLQSKADGFTDAREALQPIRTLYIDANKADTSRTKAMIARKYDKARADLKAKQGQELSALDAENEAFKARATEQGNRLTTALNQVTALKTAYSRVKDKLLPLYADKKAHEDEIADLQGLLGGLKQIIPQQRAVQKGALGQTETVGARIAQLSAEIDILNARFIELVGTQQDFAQGGNAPINDADSIFTAVAPANQPPTVSGGQVLTPDSIKAVIKAKEKERDDRQEELRERVAQLSDAQTKLDRSLADERNHIRRIQVLEPELAQIKEAITGPEAEDLAARNQLFVLWKAVDGVITPAELAAYVAKKHGHSAAGKDIAEVQAFADTSCEAANLKKTPVDEMDTVMEYVKEALKNRILALQTMEASQHAHYSATRDQIEARYAKELRIAKQNEENANTREEQQLEKTVRRIRADFDRLEKLAQKGRGKIIRHKNAIKDVFPDIAMDAYELSARAQAVNLHTAEIAGHDRVIELHRGRKEEALAITSELAAQFGTEVARVSRGELVSVRDEIDQEGLAQAKQAAAKSAIAGAEINAQVTQEFRNGFQRHLDATQEEIQGGLAAGEKKAQRAWELMNGSLTMGDEELQAVMAGLHKMKEEMRAVITHPLGMASEDMVEVLGGRIKTAYTIKKRERPEPEPAPLTWWQRLTRGTGRAATAADVFDPLRWQRVKL